MDLPAPTLFALLITPLTIPQYQSQYHKPIQFQRGHQVEYSANSKSQGNPKPITITIDTLKDGKSNQLCTKY